MSQIEKNNKLIKKNTSLKDAVHSVGGRKTSVAKVWLSRGTGNISVNDLPLDSYFSSIDLIHNARRPFLVTNTLGSYDVFSRVSGGGKSAQSQALALAISKSMLSFDISFKENLRPNGLLTRDPREVQRKVPGHRKARKKPQFSKR